MNYKPTEEELIGYLYNELTSEENERIAQFLADNPEEKKKLQNLQDTRLFIGQYEDEELPQQITLLPTQNSKDNFWRRYVAVAAAILILFTMAWIGDFQMQYSPDGFALGFGELNPGLTEEQVAQMIYNDQLELVDYMQANLKANQDSLSNQLQIFEASLNPTELVKTAFQQEKEQLMGQMVSLNDDLSADYREILRQIVVNFSNNIESQRIEDLRGIQAAFTDLEDATIGKQFELAEALEILSERIDAVALNSNNNK